MGAAELASLPLGAGEDEREVWGPVVSGAVGRGCRLEPFSALVEDEMSSAGAESGDGR